MNVTNQIIKSLNQFIILKIRTILGCSPLVSIHSTIQSEYCSVSVFDFDFDLMFILENSYYYIRFFFIPVFNCILRYYSTYCAVNTVTHSFVFFHILLSFFLLLSLSLSLIMEYTVGIYLSLS